ncbi:hypothetical protein FWF89_00965 [Candidatus Saccharibacteria bacterium]|nr:hypothetical protein [Candidatus Saccharibacteria bacterium]
MNKTKSTPTKQDKKSNLKPLIFIIILVIAAAITTAIIVINSDPAEAPGHNDVIDDSDVDPDYATYIATDWSDWGAVPYKSSEYGFTVNFPGSPIPEHQNLDVDDIIVPYSTYSIENNNKAYVAAVSSYPKDKVDIMAKPRDVLEGSVNGSAQNSGSRIKSFDNDREFLGNPAAFAVLENTSGVQTATMRCLYFLKNNNLYMLMTINVDQAEFYYFSNSFKFS